MLITLRTQNTSTDTSRFQNFYTEGLTIPPNSEIALVNMSYNVADEIAISGANNTFEVRVGNQDAFQTVSIVEGNYADASALVTAVGTALTAHFNSQSAYIQSLFPPADQTITVTNNNVVTFHLVFQPTSIDPVLLQTLNQPVGTEINAYRSEDNNISGSQGYFCTTGQYNETTTPTFITTDDLGQGGGDYVLVPTIISASQTYASCSVETINISNYSTRNDILALGDIAGQSLALSPVQVEFDYSVPSLQIKELDSTGTRNVVSSAPIPLVTGQSLEIRVPQFPDETSGVVKRATYFYNGDEIALDSDNTKRYSFNFRTNFYPKFHFAQPQIGMLIEDVTSLNVPATFSINNAGVKYDAGLILEQVSVTPGGGTGMTVMVTAVNYIAPGSVTSFKVQNPGSGYSIGDVITFTSAGHAQVFKLSVDSLQDRTPVIAVGGSGYTDQEEVDVEFPGATPAGGQKAVAIVTASSNAGVLTGDTFFQGTNNKTNGAYTGISTSGGSGFGLTLSYTVGAYVTNAIPDFGPTAGVDLTITNGGSGYTIGDSLTIDSGAGTPNTSFNVATLDNGAVTSVKIKVGSPGRGYQIGDVCTLTAGGGETSASVTIGALQNKNSAVHKMSATLTDTAVLNNPLLAESNAHMRFNNLALRDILDMQRIYNGTNGLDAEAKGPVASNNTSSNIAHIQVDDFNMESREAEDGSVGGVSGKTIAAVCIGKRQPDGATADEGFYFDEPFNLIYHNLNNPEQIINNQINVRITDEMNVPFVGLQHPVVLTLDLKTKN